MDSKSQISRIIRHPWHGNAPGRQAPEYVHGIVVIEEFQSKDLALEIVMQGIEDYKKEFGEENLK